MSAPRPPELVELETLAREVGRLIQTAIAQEMAEAPGTRKIGFALYLFDFGDSGWITYVANGARGDVVRMMREWIERTEQTLS